MLFRACEWSYKSGKLNTLYVPLVLGNCKRVVGKIIILISYFDYIYCYRCGKYIKACENIYVELEKKCIEDLFKGNGKESNVQWNEKYAGVIYFMRRNARSHSEKQLCSCIYVCIKVPKICTSSSTAVLRALESVMYGICIVGKGKRGRTDFWPL